MTGAVSHQIVLYSAIGGVIMGEAEGEVAVGELLSLEQAAGLAGLDSSALRRRIQAGRLRHVRIGRSYATTLRWIAESEEPGAMGRPPKRLPEHLRPSDP